MVHDGGTARYLHVQRLANEIEADEPDPAAANALQEGLGGQFGEIDLLALLQATAEREMADVQMSFGPVSPEGEAPAPGNDGTGLVDEVKNVIS